MASVAAAILKGANIVRVHDVKETVELFASWMRLSSSKRSELSECFSLSGLKIL